MFLSLFYPGPRRSRCPEREQGCGARQLASRWSAGRRRAPRKGPHAPGPPPPSKPMGPGILACDRPSQGRSGESRKLPGASRRSNPLFGGTEKERTAGRPGRPNTKPGFADCWPVRPGHPAQGDGAARTASATRQPGHDFDMRRIFELIDRRHAGELVTALGQNLHVARKRCRIARHRDHERHGALGKLARLRLRALTRRIEHHGVDPLEFRARPAAAGTGRAPRLRSASAPAWRRLRLSARRPRPHRHRRP